MHPTLPNFSNQTLDRHFRFEQPSYTLAHVLDKVRNILHQPGWANIKYTLRNLHGLLTYSELSQMKNLVQRLPLQRLVEQQPRFVYKYLSHYTAASFSRPKRLEAILHHYTFLSTQVKEHFFTSLASQAVVWQERHGDDSFTISLSYPKFAHFEGEISLNFSVNSTLIQLLTFVIVPGALVQLANEHVLLIGQVQGTLNGELIKQATKTLHDITPATLLVNAAYGLAAAWGIEHLAGVGMQQQLSVGTSPSGCFDYDAFWQQFNGERTANDLFTLAVDAPEKPIEEVKAKYRSRTLRKRQYKQAVRAAVAQSFQHSFLK